MNSVHVLENVNGLCDGIPYSMASRKLPLPNVVFEKLDRELAFSRAHFHLQDQDPLYREYTSG